MLMTINDVNGDNVLAFWPVVAMSHSLASGYFPSPIAIVYIHLLDDDDDDVAILLIFIYFTLYTMHLFPVI